MIEKEGKQITVKIGDIVFLADNTCEDVGTEVCDGCHLRFRCYTYETLEINWRDLTGRFFDFGVPIGEIIKAYLAVMKEKGKTKGVDKD
jgi:hypothetical protein